MIVFPVEIQAEAVVNDSVYEVEAVSNGIVLSSTVASSINIAERVPTYDGPYELTPTDDVQILPIEEKKATQDIVINPIPQGWGRITWDGRILTVS